ncbi:MAG: rhodanese-like domain-containing protein [Gammaproteobacteria bacterium]|nr:MAG: rhodanese-like domain-containing protein [Gammaproteobacteria bacterium]
MDRFIEFATREWSLFLAAGVILALLSHGLYRDLTRKYKKIIPARAVNLMNDDDVVVVDVRELKEFNAGHISNSHHIPLDKITDRAGELEKFKDKPVLVTCKTGARSDMACMKLTKLGFSNLHSLDTGIDGWQELNLPVTKITKKKRK